MPFFANVAIWNCSRDTSTLEKANNYLSSGEIMRKESLSHSSVPCAPLNLCDEDFYQVKSTGAVVTLASSVQLLYLYCSRLPSDRYFKPSPRFVIDKVSGTCTLYLPKNCRIKPIEVKGNTKILKQLACLEACRQLHRVGALTDKLVPDIDEEEKNKHELEVSYSGEQVQYVPPELIHEQADKFETVYYCYLLELQNISYRETSLHDVVLAVRSKLDVPDESVSIDLGDSSCGSIGARYIKVLKLAPEKVLICRRFQVTLLRILLDHDLKKLDEALCTFERKRGLVAFDYLLLPAKTNRTKPSVDWDSVYSVLPPSIHDSDVYSKCQSCGDIGGLVNTKSGLVCSCMLKNSLVCTPHNGRTYYIFHTLHGLDGNSNLTLQGGKVTTYRDYCNKRYNITLDYEGQSLLCAKSVVTVHNYLLKCRMEKTKESSNTTVELPPELCQVVMSRIPLATIYSFSYIPSIMHRVESLLLASNLKKMHADLYTKNVNIPTIKVLEAITTKKCQEQLHLESLETLGDSFLKYAATQQLFKKHQHHHEGILSIRREKIIRNDTLCKLGCERKIPGFIRNEPFDLSTWIIPGDNSVAYTLEEEGLSPTGKIYYSTGRRNLKSKIVADVVEALIGAYLSAGGETAALLFMDWLGIQVDLVTVPYVRPSLACPEKYVNLTCLQSLLSYSFNDPSLLVEALTHGSYMLSEIPRCYQRLEFLGDAVLDYLITVHLYNQYPNLSPGQLTDLRSASVNNDCYAHSMLKVELHKHILHASNELQRQLNICLSDFNPSSASTFGWESETAFPKVLGDIIESLAGAIFVDSNYNKERVFASIRPLLEPLVTLESLRLHPTRDLQELCDREGYIKKKCTPRRENGLCFATMEVEANGIVYTHRGSAPNKRTAKKVACAGVLKKLKQKMESSM